MIYFLKKYWKLIFFAFSLIILVSIISIGKSDNVNAKAEEKESNITLKKEEKKEDEFKSFFVDIKGAVLNPGVYQMEEGKRIIDVINLAGGLKEDANTVNLNLSKKVTDEMYVIVYTNNELESYLSNDSNGSISCVSKECICPNKENDACIDNLSKKEEKKEDKITGKISINTATKEELMTLSGIGEAKANNIISYRNSNGNFNSIEDIKNVSGISDKIFEKIKDNITL